MARSDHRDETEFDERADDLEELDAEEVVSDAIEYFSDDDDEDDLTFIAAEDQARPDEDDRSS